MNVPTGANVKSTTLTLTEGAVTLNYVEDDHDLYITSSSLPDITDPLAHQVEDALYNLGIYTRIKAVCNADADTWHTTLKPAASVNVYDNGTLVSRFVTRTTDTSAITCKPNSYRYQTTVPRAQLDTLGWTDDTTVGAYPFITTNGYLGLEFIEAPQPHGLSLQVNGTTPLPIPSAIGTAAELDGHSIAWSVEDDRLVGRTSRKPPVIRASSSVDQRLTRLAQSEQETQEHFTSYIRQSQADQLEWEHGDYVDIQIVNAGNRWGILLTDTVRPHLDTSASCVRKIREYQNNQLNFYMPNRLVYGFSLTRAALRWGLTEEGLIGVTD